MDQNIRDIEISYIWEDRDKKEENKTFKDL